MEETGDEHPLSETPMRAPLSTSLPRLAVVASLVAACAGIASAYDEEAVADNIQPYIGGWVGMYQVNTDDLANFARSGGSGPKLDLFWPAAPNGGVSLGVAYGRLHMGANIGYQMRNGGVISNASRSSNEISSTGLYPNFNYEVIPLDFNIDLAMLPNEYPVNLLAGGSFGVGFVRIQNPFRTLSRDQFNDSGKYVSTTYEAKENVFESSNFLLATAFVGARINLARRLNLEGQLGWRVLKTDEITYSEGYDPMRLASYTQKAVDSLSFGTLEPIPVDLSGAYVRLDLRWTFASKADKERTAALDRRRKVLDRVGAQVAVLER